ncbi:hypothetical protein LY76DRAFT_216509 [Colletotrichum caudatum]|nr:hypothetical protein LY76DRAFT_216509 [Colletotrichum caudatum]
MACRLLVRHTLILANPPGGALSRLGLRAARCAFDWLSGGLAYPSADHHPEFSSSLSRWRRPFQRRSTALEARLFRPSRSTTALLMICVSRSKQLTGLDRARPGCADMENTNLPQINGGTINRRRSRLAQHRSLTLSLAVKGYAVMVYGTS